MDHVLIAGTIEDDLAEADYQEMLQELREKYSLAQIVVMLRSSVTKAYWSKVEHGQAPLSRKLRNELRALFGMPLLRLTAQEAVAGVPEDAAILQIGGADVDSGVNRIVLVAGAENVTIAQNGSGAGFLFDAQGRVTPVTWPQERTEDTAAPDSTSMAPAALLRPDLPRRKKRPFMARPVADRAQEDRRQALGVTWREIIEEGLDAIESDREARARGEQYLAELEAEIDAGRDRRRQALTEIEDGAGGWRVRADLALP